MKLLLKAKYLTLEKLTEGLGSLEQVTDSGRHQPLAWMTLDRLKTPI